jgi:putative membrane protein
VSEREKIDLRILQANERTLLAWVRTGLALMAFGFVLARIGVWLEGDDLHSGDATMSMRAGVVFLVVGTLVHPVAAFRFARARRAIVEHREIVPDATTAIRSRSPSRCSAPRSSSTS